MNEEKQRIHAMDMHDSDYVMTCNTAITSISKTVNNEGNIYISTLMLLEVCSIMK